MSFSTRGIGSLRKLTFSSRDPNRQTPLIGAVIAIVCLAGCSSDVTGPKVTNQPPVVPDLRAALVSAEWQQTARTLVARAAFSPLAAAHAYPLLGVAQYLAVQQSQVTLRGLGSGSTAADQRSEASHGAVAGASAVVLSYVFPAKAEILETIVREQAHETAGQSDLMLAAFQAGEEIGRTVGADMIARATGDHFNAINTALAPLGDGYWTSSAIPAQLVAGGMQPGVTRWFLTSANQFRPAAPPAFGSAAFNSALAEIRQISDTRTAAQTTTAEYWALNPGTPTVAGFWLDVASQEIISRGMSEREATHLFALLSATMEDAVIGCWDAKLTYWLIRPWRADINIKTLVSVGEPNHPSYPSGHSCTSSSAVEVLETAFPDKRAELDAMLTEAGMSRMYGGIHYRFDIEAGETLGRAVARFAIAADASGRSVLAAH